MKKLNNKGWSLTTMITLLCVLVLAIVAVAVLSYRMGIEKSSPNPIYNEIIPDLNDSLAD